MNATQAREIFNAAIAQATDADKIASLELAREYFCNAEFRKALSDITFGATK